MRYFIKKTTPSKKGEYLQIYQSSYIPGKGSRNKSYEAIGYVEELKKKGISDPYNYAQEKVDELNGNHKLLKEKQIGESSVLKNVGYFLPKAMFDYLNMEHDLNVVASTYKSHYVFSEFLKTMTYAQIVGPGSKQYLFERIIPSLYGAEQYSYDQILDGIEFIGTDYHKYIEVLNHHIAKQYQRNLNVGLFDCTNYYFEIDAEDEYRRKGPSKENRHDPIIGQVLLLDGDMIPLDMELYPGNESEKPYLRKRIEDMKSRNDVKGKLIQIADKGLNCARNIYSAVNEANDGYIFSKSVHGKNLSDTEKAWVLLVDDDANKWIEVRDDKKNLIYRYKECIDEFAYKCKINPDDKKETKFTVQEKRIVTYNPTLARKQKREIQKMVDRLTNKITYKEVVREELGDSVKYVNLKATTMEGENVKIATSLNQKKIDEDMAFAGYNLLVTSEINADAKDVYRAYHTLWEIEHSFRIMKTQLEARPVYVSTTDTIFGHFLIVYYALVIMRLLEFKIFNNEIPVEQLFEFIRDYRVSENYDGTFINNATISTTYSKVKEKLGLSKLGNVYLSKRDIDLLLKTKL